jgi:hypothetical protein
MVIVADATEERPSRLVTRNRTTCDAGVENDVVVSGPPGTNAPNDPSSDTSQAYLTIGLVRSVEVDTSETFSPTRGDRGYQMKDATGAALSLYVAASGAVAGAASTAAEATSAAAVNP